MSESLPNLINSDTIVRVSSTLDKSVGKKYLTDGSQETCWSSTNGLPQSITLTFPTPIIPSRLLLTFAGGFVGTHCSLSYIPLASTTTSTSSSSTTITVGSSSAGPSSASSSADAAPSSSSSSGGKQWQLYSRFFPEDVNRKQLFDVSRAEGEDPTAAGGGMGGEEGMEGMKEVKIEFEKGSDFFGRITVYELELYGKVVGKA